ncbi:30S ribosomal protein S12 methylthiotransferase RimO [Tepidibacter formicigenes]|jgi:ribosomal protein S12 methylthiotransferase|uniref:Ribosomal protein uS12 methylthiotransferase RimO n=1 Tax=Tepidibacter formicigenes DSM 15518 TaxID=1123349 RepID=A0A1M6JDU5_9FIRM|nr:30S ribosomal protein S12 methylthiotransferase RimO [Tepidibacter formicigenes]SHJ44845.1 ribosomal protein S12 methylthiotransferase [Tepidibacter formicigenes DSM 15518]
MSLKIALESLGCSKNLVDAEVMLGILKNNGHRLTSNFEQADVIIVNTCGFIESAKEESINAILEFAQYKEKGNFKILIMTGCLAQRYSNELKDEIPEIDAIVGTGSYSKIADIIKRLTEEKNIVELDELDFVYDETLPRYLSTPSYMAYLKIAEGCNNHCTYCIIPKLRGKYRSRKIEDLLKEAKSLANQGVKELVVIAQDTTRYGIDLYGEEKLSYLLRELSEIEELKWIRVMYSYPEALSEEIIRVISENKKICSYFDIPIQHCSDRILKLMNRRTTKDDIKQKIDLIRKNIPDAVLRTSIIVGFPSETEEEFDELKEFVKEVKFDRLGVFAYSKEEGTAAAKLEYQISDNIKEERREELMLIQQKISLKKNRFKIGNVYEVLVEEKLEDNVYIGRTYQDAYEIDGLVYVNTDKELEIGSFVDVKINNALEYDLMGVILDESC